MDNLIETLERIAEECTAAAGALDEPQVVSAIQRLVNACDQLGQAWSGSWIGYQALVYKDGFLPRQAGDHFDAEWGFSDSFSNACRGNWREYTSDDVQKEIYRRAGGDPFEGLAEISNKAKGAFEDCRDRLLPVIEALMAAKSDPFVAQKRNEISKIRGRISAIEIIHTQAPGQLRSRDPRATQGGRVTPPHIYLSAVAMEDLSPANALKDMARNCQQISTYLAVRLQVKGDLMPKPLGPIFIGHGQSKVWKDLKEFLVEQLELEYDEFNREPQAGRSTKERLAEMLDRCTFAFLVTTAEDETSEGRKIARQNVVHEIGLFQGRHGWERAIVLLEDGCEEFSNLHGITQIRFPKGDIMAKSEEIRRVLKREGYLK